MWCNKKKTEKKKSKHSKKKPKKKKPEKKFKTLKKKKNQKHSKKNNKSKTLKKMSKNKTKKRKRTKLWEVKSVLDMKKEADGLYFLVEWDGEYENSWEPEEYIMGCDNAIKRLKLKQACPPNPINAKPYRPSPGGYNNHFPKRMRKSKTKKRKRNKLWKVKNLLDMKKETDGLYVLVEWDGEHENSWEPEEHIMGCDNDIKRLKLKHAWTPRPINKSKTKKQKRNKLWEVKSVLDMKKEADGLYFLVEWDGEYENSWEPEEYIKGCDNAIKRLKLKQACPPKPINAKPYRSSPGGYNKHFSKRMRKSKTKKRKRNKFLEVRSVLDIKKETDIFYVLVEWEDEYENSWEPEEHIMGCDNDIKRLKIKRACTPRPINIQNRGFL